MNSLIPMLEFFKRIPGAISVTEAIALYLLIQNHLTSVAIEDESYLDFGSHAGKSSLIAIAALSNLERKGIFHMIDPAYDEKSPFRQTGNVFAPEDYKEKIFRNVHAFARKGMRTIMIGATSEEYIQKKLDLERIAYTFIDSGNHDDESVKIELDYIVPRMITKGLIVFHDFDNQYIAPSKAAARLVESKRFESILIDWDPIINFVIENDLEKRNDSWHMNGHPHPNFLGAVRRIR